MHEQPNHGPEIAGTSPRGRAHHLQRIVLLELVTNPPVEGDDVDDMSARFDVPSHEVALAVDSLVEVGLAIRRDHLVLASAAAWRFEWLWPTI